METENKSKMPMVILILSILMICAYGMIALIFRKQGIGKIMTYCVIFTIFLCIIGGIVALVIFLLKPQRKDMLWIMRQRITSACKMSRQIGKVQKLYFRGMGEDMLESSFIGHVTGMCRIKSERMKKIITNNQGLEETQDIIDEKTKLPVEEHLIIISFKKSLGFFSFLQRDELCVAPLKDYSNLNGDTIYIRDSTFAPKFYEMFFPAKYFKETYMVDEVAKGLIYRYTMQDMLSELGEIAQDFLAISPQYQKVKSMNRAQEFGFPVGGGGAQPPQQQPPQ